MKSQFTEHNAHSFVEPQMEACLKPAKVEPYNDNRIRDLKQEPKTKTFLVLKTGINQQNTRSLGML